MSTPESVTCAVALEITITLPTPPPLITVLLGPAPRTLRLLPMVRFSIYVAAATLIVSPDAANDMEWPIVLQAVVGDVQSLLSLPLTPFTYHVVVAQASEPSMNGMVISIPHITLRSIDYFLVIASLSLVCWLLRSRKNAQGTAA